LATPTWLLVGLGSALIVKALGYEQSPTRVATAAVAAWLVGFLFVPVPAGAGIREAVFIALCGLASGPGAAVAGLARVNFLLVDGIGGGAALWREHRVSRRARRTADAAAEGPIRPADGIHESEDLP